MPSKRSKAHRRRRLAAQAAEMLAGKPLPSLAQVLTEQRLDAITATWNVTRAPGETDHSLRARMMDALVRGFC